MPVKRQYLVDRSTNKKYRVNGLRPSTRLPQAANLKVDVSKSKPNNNIKLPSGVDMREFLSAVQDQSSISSCSANAIAGAYEYLLRRSRGSTDEVSRLFIYFNARLRRKAKVMSDSGCSMTEAIEALADAGTCHEKMWPYEIDRVDHRPADEAYQEAKDHRITQATKLKRDLNELKGCLAQGYPFAFGLRLYKSFDRGGRTGMVPMPKPSEPSRGRHAVHAMLAVGYSDSHKRFIVRNSWGPQWGDDGYGYVPYDYITSGMDCFDIWTVRAVDTKEFNQQHWRADDAAKPAIDVKEEEEEEEVEEESSDQWFEEIEEECSQEVQEAEEEGTKMETEAMVELAFEENEEQESEYEDQQVTAEPEYSQNEYQSFADQEQCPDDGDDSEEA